MVANLWVEFREWQQKRLNEAIEVRPSSKKQRTVKKGSSSRFAPTSPLMSLPLSPLAPKTQVVESIPFHGLGEMVTISSDDSTPSAHIPPTALIDVLNREEMDVLLEHFPNLPIWSLQHPIWTSFFLYWRGFQWRDCRPSIEIHGLCPTWDLKQDHWGDHALEGLLSHVDDKSGTIPFTHNAYGLHVLFPYFLSLALCDRL